MIVYGVYVQSEDSYRTHCAPGIASSSGDSITVVEARDVDSVAAAYNEVLDAFSVVDDLDALVLLRDDVEICDPSFTRKVDRALTDPDVAVIGVVGASGVRSLSWWEGSPRGVCSTTHGVLDFGGGNAEVEAVAGFVLVLSPWAVRHLRFDEHSYPASLGYAVDLSFQARASGKKVLVADLVVHHHDAHGETVDAEDSQRAEAAFQAKWFSDALQDVRFVPGAPRQPTSELQPAGIVSQDYEESGADTRLLRDQVDALTDAASSARHDLAELREALATVLSAQASTIAMVQQLTGTLSTVASRREPVVGPAKVIFLVHHIEAWSSLEGVYREMASSADFDPIVASIPRAFGTSSDFGEEDRVHEGLTSRGIEHIRLDYQEPYAGLNVIRAIGPDIIFRQSQWDNDIQPAYSTDSLSPYRLCIVPYETMPLIQSVPMPGSSNDWGVDSPFHRACWMAFCANPLILEAVETVSPLRGRQFHVTGHPKADYLRAAEPRWPLMEEPDRGPFSKIVWSAHHSILTGWIDFGTFPSVCVDMLEWAREAPEKQFTFMPHPQLVSNASLPGSPIDRRCVKAVLEAWEALPNTSMYQGPDYASVLAGSDVVVTDGLSMLIEPQVIHKPIVFIERPGHRPFNKMGNIARSGFHTAVDVSSVRRLITSLEELGHDPLRGRQEAAVRTLFGEGSSSKRIVDAIRQRLDTERSGSARGSTAEDSRVRPMDQPPRPRGADLAGTSH